jgi:hypothetical protein
MLHLTHEGWVSASAAVIDNMSDESRCWTRVSLPVDSLFPSVLRSLED